MCQGGCGAANNLQGNDGSDEAWGPVGNAPLMAAVAMTGCTEMLWQERNHHLACKASTGSSHASSGVLSWTLG